jgi:hypothetical protein
MRTLTIACAVLLCGGCFTSRTVERKDWGALPQNGDLRVTMLDGSSRRYNRFVFTSTALEGWNRAGTGRDSTVADSAAVPLDSIGTVRVSQFNQKGTVLVLAAAATAAFIVIAEGKSDVRPTPVPRPTVSCPFIYSWNGREYVFDSETYAGAIARGLERADVDNLDHLRASDGRYRLRITNERPETHYTDELSLLVADHPRGTRVYPDVTGATHAVRGGVAPVGSREYGGDTIPSRAGWELSFPRPAGDSAALVIRTRNTYLAPFVLYSVLSLLGSDIYSWYRAVGNDFMTRSVVRGWIEREGSLEVLAGQGAAWRSVAKVPDVGPAIAKTHVIPIDLRGAGDTVRVRLESSPGLWLLESAELGVHTGRVETRVLAPMRATDERGMDVTAALSARDGRYLVTARGSDVTVEYQAMPLPQDRDRTVLARTTGHYYVHTDDRAAPRAEIVARLMRDRAYLQNYFRAERDRSGAR